MGGLPGENLRQVYFFKMNSDNYLSELMQFCDPYSLLAIGFEGQLIRIYTPFTVIVRQSVGELFEGDVHLVDFVKITKNLEDVFIIHGKAYSLHNFKILI